MVTEAAAPPAPRTYRPWAASVTGNLIVRVLGLLAGIVIARSLGPAGRGEITGAVLWPMLVISIGTMVTIRCVAYFGARHGREGIIACLIVCGAVALLALPLTWGINWYTLGVRGRLNYFGANIYALTVPLSMLSALFAATLLVEGRVGFYWFNEAITAGLTAVAVLVLAPFDALNATTFAIGAVIAVGISLVVTATLQRSITAPFAAGVSARLVGRVMVYAVQVGLTLVPFQLTTRIDQLLVSMAASAGTLGNYTVAAAWSTVLSLVGVGFSTVILSDSARVDLKNAEHMAVATGRLRRATLIVLLAGLATCIAAPIAIPLLYGADFKPAILPAMILSVAAIPLYMNLMLHEFSRGVGLPSAGWLPESAGVAVGLGALKLLYFRYGMLGAATASLISYCVVLVLLLYRLSRDIELLRLGALLPRRADVSAVWEASKQLLRRTVRRSAQPAL